jgi:hypothetical protein
MGLPCIPYILIWTSKISDSALGISILSIIAINILYGPVQFIIDQRYYEGFFTKQFDFVDFVKCKLLFLQIVNAVMFLMVIPLLFLFFDISRLLFVSSVFLYSIGIASPATILLSGWNFRFIDNSYSKKHKMTSFRLRNIFFGLIPFVPGCLLLYMFSSNYVSLVFINFVIVVITLFFNGSLCKNVGHNILNKKFLC